MSTLLAAGVILNQMAVFEEPAYRAAVRLLPGLDPLGLGHLGSLIQF
jgi:hypothetical protein